MKVMKKRLHHTLFRLTVGLTALSAFASTAFADDCAPNNIEIWADASFALKGDTVIIQNKQFRLIGLKAPQIEKKQKFNTPGQPFAKEAQDRLNKFLANHDLTVGVEYDEKKTDEFYRSYAHLYVKNKQGKILNLQKMMLESGYVLAHSEHPNMLHQQCYYAAEKKARQQEITLWDLAQKRPDIHYPIAESSKLTPDDEGFRIFRGEIVSVSKSSNNYILNMDTTGIRIRKAHWDQFDYKALQALKGKTVEVRGYGFLFRGAMFVKISSPNAIDLLNPVNK